MIAPEITGESVLLSISQIGLGFGGFVGIILALRYNPQYPWTPNEKYGMLFVFAHSFWLVVAGLLPTVLIVPFREEPTVWPFCHLAMIGFLLCSVVVNAWRLNRVVSTWAVYRRKPLFLYYQVPTIAIVLVIVILLFRGSAGFTLYVLELGWVLFAAGVQFYLLLHHFFRQTDQTMSS